MQPDFLERKLALATAMEDHAVMIGISVGLVATCSYPDCPVQPIGEISYQPKKGEEGTTQVVLHHYGEDGEQRGQHSQRRRWLNDQIFHMACFEEIKDPAMPLLDGIRRRKPTQT